MEPILIVFPEQIIRDETDFEFFQINNRLEKADSNTQKEMVSSSRELYFKYSGIPEPDLHDEFCEEYDSEIQEILFKWLSPRELAVKEVMNPTIKHLMDILNSYNEIINPVFKFADGDPDKIRANKTYMSSELKSFKVDFANLGHHQFHYLEIEKIIKSAVPKIITENQLGIVEILNNIRKQKITGSDQKETDTTI